MNPLQNVAQMIGKTYLYDPQRGRVAPSSPYWSFQDAQNVQDPKKRNQALQDAALRLVVAGTTGGPKTTQSVADRWRQAVAGRMSSRPQHQALLEAAARSRDWARVSQILDSIPQGDPYKGPMEQLFRSQAAKGAVNPRMGQIDDFDHAVDLMKGKVGTLDDQMAAQTTIMREAKRQLTPQELASQKGKLDQIINIIQKRLKPEESGLEGILKRLKKTPPFDPGDY